MKNKKIITYGWCLIWTVSLLVTIYFIADGANPNPKKINKSLKTYTIENPYISEEFTKPLDFLDFKEDHFQEICHDHRIYLYHKESNQIIQKANNYKC